MQGSGYKKLAILLPINTVIMFLLTYLLIDSWAHFYPNINRAYMAIIMAAPMGLMMMVMMGAMFQNRKLNAVLYALFISVIVGIFFIARSQTGVGNKAFLQSMIPHHSSAILMCEEASLSDPEIIELCGRIVQTQKDEIAQMKQILTRY